MGLLDALIYGVRTLLEAGTEKPLRSRLNLIGATIADNVADDRLDVTIAGTGILPKLTLVDQVAEPALTAAATVLGSSAGVLSIVSPTGARRTFEGVSGTATKRQISELIGPKVRTVSTASATLLTVPIPAMSVFELEVTVLGLKSDGTAAIWFRKIVRGARGAGSSYDASAPIVSVVADEDGSAVLAATFGASALTLAITGPSGATVDWCSAAVVFTFSP